MKKKKKVKKAIALGAGMLCMSGVATAFAGTAETEDLKQQIQQVIYQNQQLTARIAELEEMVRAGVAGKEVSEEALQSKVHQAVQDEMNKQQEEEGMAQKINKYVTFGGVIEVEAGLSEDFDGVSGSDIALAKADFGFEAQLTQWGMGTLNLTWDDEDDKITVDEAFITLGNIDEFPLFLQAGRYVVPFGVYEANTISDPLTKEAFEITEDAIMLGVDYSGFYANAYVFNGDTNEGGGDDTIEHYGANVGYAFENDTITFAGGVDLINSVFDTDGLTDGFPDSMESDYAAGLATHATFGMAGFGIFAEYITALDDVDGIEPEAWQLEGAYVMELGERELVFALGYSKTDELAEVLPESRIAAVVGIGLFDGMGLTFEYTHDEDYDTDDGGTGEGADAFTTQLAYEF